MLWLRSGGNTAVGSWRLRSGAEHCHPTLAVEEDDEERRGQARKREENSEAANNKSNNPQAGKKCLKNSAS